jgi:hypothetical protein
MSTKKNAAAAELARRRWKKTPKAERVEIARTNSNTRWANATEEERAALGQQLAEARARARKKGGGKD